METGETVRTDCTVVESNIHEPSDSELLWDCVRVLTRLLGQARDVQRCQATLLWIICQGAGDVPVFRRPGIQRPKRGETHLET